MRTILTTVGISLIAPNKHGGSKPDEQKLANYLRHTPPIAASAETNSLSRILVEDDRIIFLVSDTTDGKFCAEALRKHYASLGYTASIKVVSNLTYAASSFRVKGLRSLVSTLIDLVREHKTLGKVLINATGGFKAEMAYANLIGLLFNVPVFYIHEAFKNIIEMPAPPIGWDYSLIADYEEFFEWINADFRPTAEVQRRLQSLPQAVGFLLEEEGNFTLLSPTGDVFFQAFLQRQEVYASIPILLSEKALQTYGNADGTMKEIFARTLRKLRDPQLRNSGSGQVNNCDCWVYPRGNRTERLFWFAGPDGNPHVCELALHDRYEDLIQQGVNKAQYHHFEEWRDPLSS